MGFYNLTLKFQIFNLELQMYDLNEREYIYIYIYTHIYINILI